MQGSADYAKFLPNKLSNKIFCRLRFRNYRVGKYKGGTRFNVGFINDIPVLMLQLYLLNYLKLHQKVYLLFFYLPYYLMTFL